MGPETACRRSIWAAGSDVRVVVGRELVSALVGSVAVEVAGVVVEDFLGMAAVEQQQGRCTPLEQSG